MNNAFIRRLQNLLSIAWQEKRAPSLTRLHGLVLPLVILYNLFHYYSLAPSTSLFSSICLHLSYVLSWFFSLSAVDINIYTLRGIIPPDFIFCGRRDYSVKIWIALAGICTTISCGVAIYDKRWTGVAMAFITSTLCTVPGLRYSLAQLREKSQEFTRQRLPKGVRSTWRTRRITVPRTIHDPSRCV